MRGFTSIQGDFDRAVKMYLYYCIVLAIGKGKIEKLRRAARARSALHAAGNGL